MKEKNIGIVSNGVYLINKNGFAYNIPAFTGGESEGVFAGGDNRFIDCIKNASQSDVTDYIDTLGKQGYKKALENKICDNIFYSFTDEKILYTFIILLP